MKPHHDDDVALHRLRTFFDEAGELPPRDRIRFALRHPLRTVRAVHDAHALPSMARPRATGPDADLIEAALGRSTLPVVQDFWSISAVLGTSPEERREARPGRAMRRAMRLAERAQLQWREVPAGIPQQQLLDRARAFQWSRDPSRPPDPEVNEGLLGRGMWLVAETADGRPLLQVVALVDGEWALLANLRTVESSTDAGNARFWMTAVLADELSAHGVRHLVEATHPVRLSNGLRYFQRISGFRWVRLRTTEPCAELGARLHRSPGETGPVRDHERAG